MLRIYTNSWYFVGTTFSKDKEISINTGGRDRGYKGMEAVFNLKYCA